MTIVKLASISCFLISEIITPSNRGTEVASVQKNCLIKLFRGGSRAAITKRSILDVAAALDPPLLMLSIL